MSLRVVLCAAVVVGCSAATMYDPPNAGVALDAIEKALNGIVNSPHLTKVQLAQAKKVSADVEGTVAYLGTAEGKKLSKVARAAKVTASIKELQGLQTEWQKNAISNKKTDLEKKLKTKMEELVKDKKMLKVITLEKALMEKKLKLQKLIDMKKSRSDTAASQKKAAEQQEMVAKVLSAAKTLKGSKSADKLKTVSVYLEDRMHKVSASLAKLDATEKKGEAELKAVTEKQMPVQDNKDPLAKSQGILKMLLKKEHRQFLKTKAPLQAELKELHQAVTSIKKGDVAGLSKVMAHMQGEMKNLEAKSHKFLY